MDTTGGIVMTALFATIGLIVTVLAGLVAVGWAVGIVRIRVMVEEEDDDGA
jgi:pheromone shutdown protein TraB